MTGEEATNADAGHLGKRGGSGRSGGPTSKKIRMEPLAPSSVLAPSSKARSP